MKNKINFLEFSVKSRANENVPESFFYIYLERLKKLEESQKKSVESVLEDLQHLIRSPLFQKDQAIDYLVNLKIVARETKHAKAGFYSAVLTAMQKKNVGLKHAI